MNRYYVELKGYRAIEPNFHIYIRAYSERQIREMFIEYVIVAIDLTD